MAKYIEKLSRFRQIIKENGGLFGSVRQLYRFAYYRTLVIYFNLICTIYVLTLFVSKRYNEAYWVAKVILQNADETFRSRSSTHRTVPKKNS